MKDKTLQAIIKLKDEFTKPIANVSNSLKDNIKILATSKKALKGYEEANKKTSSQINDLKGKMVETNRTILNLKNSISQGKDKTGEMKRQLDEATKSMSEMKQKSAELNRELEKQKSASNSVTEKHEALKGKLGKVSKVSAAAGAAITGSIGGIFGASAKVGMEFEASMSKVQAVMGATPAQLKQLEKSARDAGAKTTKSASDAANALEYMGLAGWNVKESQEALMPVLKLSEAGAMDLGTTSDLVTDSMSALGLKMSEIGQSGLNNYLDMVAKTSNSSNTNIQQLMEGLIIVGGTAKNLNVPMEELNAIMGIMANRGLKGTESATALNSVLINMTTGAGQAGKAMKELNLKAFDSKGKFKGLGQIFKDLNEKLKGMTQEQKNNYLAMIGGKTQVDALQKILDGVGDEYDELKGKIKDSEGALKTMSDVMNDNSKGGIAQLKSALEEAGIAIYTNLKPAIGEITKHIQDAVNWFNGLDDKTKRNIVNFGIIALAIGGVLLAIGLLLPIIASAITVFGALAGAGITLGAIIGFLTSPIMLVIGAIAFLAWAWKTNFLGMRDSAKILVDKVRSGFNSIKEKFREVKEKCKEFGDSIKKTWNSIKEFLKHPIKGTVELIKKGAQAISGGGSKKGKRSAFGTRRVIGNEIPFRLHDGERVLTKGEAKRLDNNQFNGVNITINGMTVREEADIDRVATKLVKKLNQNKVILGGV